LVFNVNVEVEATPDEGPEIITPGLVEPRRPTALQYTAPDIDAAGGLSQSVARTGPIIDPEFGEVSKNALCPCGSGRKYKRCHGDPKQRA
jgi:preprotein translocase subunit SecA